MKWKLVTLLTLTAMMAGCDCTDQQPVSVSDSEGVGAGTGTSDVAKEFASQTEDKVFYAFDKFDLTPTSRTSLEGQAKWLQNNKDVSVEVQGYCDKRGPVAYNDRLGQRRADAAAHYLVHLGVDEGRVKTVSFGNRVTLVPGTTEAAYAQNRVAITVAH
ncbi:MAG: OmpA family protein [Holosporaceae bacterium]